MTTLVLNPKKEKEENTIVKNWSKGTKPLVSLQASHLWFIREQAESTGARHRLNAVIHPQFLEDVGHMAFDGIQGNHQHLSNLLVRVTACDQMEHFQFAFA